MYQMSDARVSHTPKDESIRIISLKNTGLGVEHIRQARPTRAGAVVFDIFQNVQRVVQRARIRNSLML